MPEAQYNLVVFYEYGDGVEKNQAKALEWCMKAAEQGANKAQYYLAKCYEEGKGVEKDLAKAKEWLAKATEN